MNDLKILFCGPMGAGKTTAISAVSDTPPLSTEVQNNDAGLDKITTTVAFDYGTVLLEDGQVVRLVGAPGQDRFGFMRRLLAKNALGAILLLDHCRPAPLDDFRSHLDTISTLLSTSRVVVGVGCSTVQASVDLTQYVEVLNHLGAPHTPVFTVDVRRREDVVLLIETLLHEIEMACHSRAQ